MLLVEDLRHVSDTSKHFNGSVCDLAFSWLQRKADLSKLRRENAAAIEEAIELHHMLRRLDVSIRSFMNLSKISDDEFNELDESLWYNCQRWVTNSKQLVKLNNQIGSPSGLLVKQLRELIAEVDAELRDRCESEFVMSSDLIQKQVSAIAEYNSGQTQPLF